MHVVGFVFSIRFFYFSFYTFKRNTSLYAQMNIQYIKINYQTAINIKKTLHLT